MTLNIQLNTKLDSNHYREVFRRHSRIHIPEILTPDSAKCILENLQNKVPWQAHFNDEEKTYDLHRDQIALLPDDKKTLIVEKLHQNAQSKFQYVFLNYSISDAVEQKSNPDVELNSFLDFVNSDEMLNFVRTITQIKEIKFADCQATLYRPGHFLRAHNDDIEQAGRLLAYTFNFTPHWDTDYGGILQFLDEEGDVDEGYSPKFNALNLFKIPTRHCVSYVTPFAAVGRYSLIGWFRR